MVTHLTFCSEHCIVNIDYISIWVYLGDLQHGQTDGRQVKQIYKHFSVTLESIKKDKKQAERLIEFTEASLPSSLMWVSIKYWYLST